jgi:hypothetical protein
MELHHLAALTQDLHMKHLFRRVALGGPPQLAASFIIASSQGRAPPRRFAPARLVPIAISETDCVAGVIGLELRNPLGSKSARIAAVPASRGRDIAGKAGGRRRRWRAGDFLVSRGMRLRGGRKSTDRHCGNVIEAQPTLGQISPSEAASAPRGQTAGDFTTVGRFRQEFDNASRAIKYAFAPKAAKRPMT